MSAWVALLTRPGCGIDSRVVRAGEHREDGARLLLLRAGRVVYAIPGRFVAEVRHLDSQRAAGDAVRAWREAQAAGPNLRVVEDGLPPRPRGRATSEAAGNVVEGLSIRLEEP